MFNVVVSIIHFALIVSLTFVNGYWLITLDELELDHLNPADVARKLNRLVYPELICHGLLLLIELISFSPYIFLINLGAAFWFIYKFQKNELFIDPTEILRYKKLKQTRYEAIGKTVFYGIQICYAMYWMVSAIVSSFRPGRKGVHSRRRQQTLEKAGIKSAKSATFDY